MGLLATMCRSHVKLSSFLNTQNKIYSRAKRVGTNREMSLCFLSPRSSLKCVSPSFVNTLDGLKRFSNSNSISESVGKNWKRPQMLLFGNVEYYV